MATLLTEIEVLINNDNASNVILGGDINYDITRSSRAALLIKDWLVKMDLCSVWEKFHVDFTHHHINFTSISTIDHVMVSHDIMSVVKAAGVYHHAEEFSRHNPIWMTMDLG